MNLVRFLLMYSALFGVLCAPSHAQVVDSREPSHADEVDSYLWLEEIESERALSWTLEQSERTVARLTADPRFEQLKSDFLASYQRSDRLPEMFTLVQANGYVYRVEQRPDHPRGLFQRARPSTLGQASAEWETLIDIDALAKAEGRNWYLSVPMTRISPDGTRALVALSDGGTDAATMREFDLTSGSFVANGFRTPLARQMIAWVDQDTLAIAIVLKPDEATTSGYPRTMRYWRRGTKLNDIEPAHSISADNVLLAPFVAEAGGERAVLMVTAKSFVDLTVQSVSPGAPPETIALPISIGTAWSGIGGVGNEVLLYLQQDFQIAGSTFAAGSIIAADLDAVLSGKKKSDAYRTVYAPSSKEALGGAPTIVSDAAYFIVLDDVISKLKRATRGPDGEWQVAMVDVPGAQDGGTFTIVSTIDPTGEATLAKFENFLTPPTLYSLSATGGISKAQQAAVEIDLSGYETRQYFAKAEDGTQIPYFIVGSKGQWDTAAPTLMYGYGGFGIPMVPTFEVPYLGPMHQIWLGRGGRFVLANVRGGGEYGPAWHNAARGTSRQIVYDDFAAIAEDVVARGLSRPQRIGFAGGSNGGLTAGVLATQRPDLFGAAISLVPLLDMARFHKLLAGASWIPEYGNPDVAEQAEPLLRYSPYQNIQPGKAYPEMLLMTSTRDDRVHPGHARKMAAKLIELGHPALFYEAREGGHAMAVSDEGRAFNSALQTVYLLQKLMDSSE